MDTETNPPKGLVGSLLEDTLSNVSDTLLVLSHVEYEDCGSTNEFTCGMVKILNLAMEAIDYEKDRIAILRANS